MSETNKPVETDKPTEPVDAASQKVEEVEEVEEVEATAEEVPAEEVPADEVPADEAAGDPAEDDSGDEDPEEEDPGPAEQAARAAEEAAAKAAEAAQKWGETASQAVREWSETAQERSQKVADDVRVALEDVDLKIDPERLDESLKNLGARLRGVVDQGRYTRVRLSYKGKQLGPEIPMGVFLAGEVATAWWAGPMRAIVFNLGVKSFIDVELVHEASDRVREGVEYFMDGEVELAEEKYREALKMKPDDTAALYNLAVVCRVSGRKDEARELFSKAAQDEDHPDGARAREALGRMASREKEKG